MEWISREFYFYFIPSNDENNNTGNNINLDRMLAPFRKYLEKVFESSLLSIRVSKSIYSVRYILLTKELISV